MKDCIPQFGRFMPTLIRNYLPSIPPATRSSWFLFTAKLLAQFGIPEDEENRHLVTQLRQCKQQRNETVQLFNARRHHIVSLLPDGHLKSYQFIQIYTQALRHEGLRTILIAFIE